ncbi:hypothetical protein ACFCWG_32280 [Streptomyces sp. NPDC056390]|uniref:hypothetical protein n=1 Tax=Streptomyces sp. NPDC056390 TaxID=3345806 RepID=UPI0035DCB6CB
MTWRVWAWIGGIVWIVALGLLIGYLSIVGLDRADKISSVLALCLAVVGLALQLVSMVLERQSVADASPVTKVVGGSVVVVRGVRGRSSLRLHRPRGFAGLPTRRGTAGQPTRQTYIRGNEVRIEDVGSSDLEER